MIQRIQSLWLLLAAVAMFLVIKLPFAIGQNAMGQTTDITVDGSLAILLGVGALVIIFLFKKRSNQRRLIWLAILTSLLFIVLMYFQVEGVKTNGQTTHFRAGAICPIIYIIFMIMAYSGIRRDEKLIKSVDRLR